MRNGRAAGAVVAAAAAWFAMLQTAAVAATVDLSVTVYDDSSDHAMGEEVPLYVELGNNADSGSGSVTLTLQATNGTIGTVDTSGYTDITCDTDGTAAGTCHMTSLGSYDYREIAVPVTADTPAGPGSSETVTLTASISSAGDSDSNSVDNESSGAFTAQRAPAVTISHKFVNDPDQPAGDPTNPANAAVEVFLKDAAGHLVPNQTVEVYDRKAGSNDGWYDEGSVSPGSTDYPFDYLILNPPNGTVPLDFRLVHQGNIDAGPAEETFTKAPRAVQVKQSAPTLSTTWGSHPVLKGALTFSDDGSPVGYVQTIALDHRANSDAAWSKVADVPADWLTGKFSTTISPKASGEYRWRYAGGFFGAAPAVGPPIAVTVHQAMVTSLSPVAIPPGGQATLTVAVKPGAVGKQVTLQQHVGAVWKNVQSRTLTSKGTFAWQFHPASVGQPTYRVVKPATADLAPGVGRSVTLDVTRKGRGPASSYVFEGKYNGHPTSWNPCNTIDFKVNLAHAPKQGLADVKEAVRRVHLAGGLKFRYRGTTHEVPTGNPTGQKAELLIGWRPAASVPEFQLGLIVGLGGYSSIVQNGHDTITRGFVMLDAGFHPAAGFGYGTTWGQLMMHELGHAVGLAHSTGNYQIMRPMMDDRLYAAMYGAGDLAGLHKLGKSQGCW